MSEAESKSLLSYSDVAVFEKGVVSLTTAVMQGKLIPGRFFLYVLLVCRCYGCE